jgi:hypothetical protein
VTALPMIMRWISDVPSKMVKLVEVRAVSAGRWPAGRALVSTNSARLPGRHIVCPDASYYVLASFSRRLVSRSLISWSADLFGCLACRVVEFLVRLESARAAPAATHRRSLW